jgi:hypothetical protein
MIFGYVGYDHLLCCTRDNRFNKYLQDCLKRRDIDLNDRVIKRYVHGLIVNVGGLGQHLIDVHAALERFHQVVEQGYLSIYLFLVT